MLVLFQYRTAAIAGLTTQVFWGLMKIMILSAFYATTTSSQPLSLTQAITFIWLGQALLELLPWTIDKEIEAEIKTGNIAYQLTKPLDLYWHLFFRSLALRLAPTIWKIVPLFLFAALVYHLPAPVSIEAGIFFAISLFLSSLLSAAITTFFIITLFWTLSADGLQNLIAHFSILLSGLLIPLPLFPSCLQPFLNFQPLRGIVDIPARLYTGVITTEDGFYYLSFQVVWILVFIVFSRYLLRKAMKKFVIQGG
jgi:ABC-2 type transport system permease protein